MEERKEKLKNLRRNFIFLGVIVLGSLLFMNLASAEFWACFDRGQIINFCNPNVQDRTCSGNGCFYCMSSFDLVNNCYHQGNFNICNGVARTCSTDGGDGGGTDIGIDEVPPVFTLLNPLGSGVYDSRTIPLIFELDEKADVYYMDNINRPGRWIRICDECTEGERRSSFRDGFNHLTFRFVDVVGNEDFMDVDFTVDSKRPRITMTNPRRGFASGFFDVEFQEENPDLLVLKYGNDAVGFDEKEVDFENECIEGRRGQNCQSFVDLEMYDGQMIQYWYELTDIAGTMAISRASSLEVDTTDPAFSYEVVQDEGSVTLLLEITEMNFDRAVYEILTDLRPRERTLCSRLRDIVDDTGTCERRIRLADGTHLIKMTVRDEVGNSAEEEVEIIV